METERIKAPEGVRKLMEELWAKHRCGERHSGCNVYMVDLPEPTEEEKRIMAENRRKRVCDNDIIEDSHEDLFGGWI